MKGLKAARKGSQEAGKEISPHAEINVNMQQDRSTRGGLAAFHTVFKGTQGTVLQGTQGTVLCVLNCQLSLFQLS